MFWSSLLPPVVRVCAIQKELTLSGLLGPWDGNIKLLHSTIDGVPFDMAYHSITKDLSPHLHDYFPSLSQHSQILPIKHHLHLACMWKSVNRNSKWHTYLRVPSPSIYHHKLQWPNSGVMLSFDCISELHISFVGCTVCLFYCVPEDGICHEMFCQMLDFCLINLPC